MSLISISSEAELLNSFRPHDRKTVYVPRGWQFPISQNYYLAWVEPYGVRTFLAFKEPQWKHLVGVSFRRDQQGSSVSAPGMCDWCHAHGTSDQIGLLTTRVSSNRRVGVNLCLDLSCIDKMADAAKQMGMDLDRMAAVHRQRMAHFCQAALGFRFS
ncbi:MAG: FBP domain-containing protein [Bdellovibrionales bacterium]|nr:FBP domain-containing protein [Bdellovibrionales bacterium]